MKHCSMWLSLYLVYQNWHKFYSAPSSSSSDWHDTACIACMTNDMTQAVSHISQLTQSKLHHIQSGPKKCIHSLLINIFGINLNEISISGWECNIIYNSRTSPISILLLYKYSSYDYRVIFFTSKCVYILLGHSVLNLTGCMFYVCHWNWNDTTHTANIKPNQADFACCFSK